MKFSVSSSLLDACVLGVLVHQPTYGYDLTQKIGQTLGVSQSTLYPVLRRLQKDGFLESFDEAFDGRNRRYYKITPQGTAQLQQDRLEWQSLSKVVRELLFGGSIDDQA